MGVRAGCGEDEQKEAGCFCPPGLHRREAGGERSGAVRGGAVESGSFWFRGFLLLSSGGGAFEDDGFGGVV